MGNYRPPPCMSKGTAVGTKARVAQLMLNKCKQLGVQPPQEVLDQLAVAKAANDLKRLYDLFARVAKRYERDSFIAAVIGLYENDITSLADMLRNDGSSRRCTTLT